MNSSRHLFLLFFFIIISSFAFGQRVDGLNPTAITVDGKPITLFQELRSNGQPTNNYYYLPSPDLFTIPNNKNGKLDFALFKFTSDADEKQCPYADEQGGVFHCSIQWKFDKAFHNKIQRSLKKENPSARLKGVVDLKSESLRFLTVLEGGAIKKDTLNKLITSSTPPNKPGGMAGAQKILTIQDTKLIEEEILSGQPSLAVEMRYKYKTHVPAASFSIIYHWSKLYEEKDQIKEKYEKWTKTKLKFSANIKAKFSPVKSLKGILGWFGGSKLGLKTVEKEYVNHDIIKDHYEFLTENEYITTQITLDNFDDDSEQGNLLRKKITEAFFDQFLNVFANQEDGSTDKSIDKSKKVDAKTSIKTNKNTRQYTYDAKIQNSVQNSKDYEADVRAGLTIDKEHVIYVPLGSLMASCPECIHTFNICDPFYQRINIIATPNLATKRMLEDGVLNQVSVVVKKQIPGKPEWYTSRTLTRNTFTSIGALEEDMLIRYARPENDANYHSYDYSLTFSSGMTNKEHVVEKKSDKPHINVAIPLRPIEISLLRPSNNFMEELNIFKVSAVIVYKQFGKDRHKVIDLRADERFNPLKTIYMDIDGTSFKYSLIFKDQNGKEFGSDFYEERVSQLDYEGEDDWLGKKDIAVYSQLERMELLEKDEQGNISLDEEKLPTYKAIALRIWEAIKKDR